MLEQLKFHFQLFLNEITPATIFAIGAATLWLGILQYINLPLKDNTEQLSQQLVKTTNENSSGKVQISELTTKKKTSVKEQFLAFLPTQTNKTQQLKLLHSLASNNQVELNTITYSKRNLIELPVSIENLDIVIKGNQYSIRAFIHHLLKQLPNLAIEQITIEHHHDLNRTDMAATLKASMYYRNGR